MKHIMHLCYVNTDKQKLAKMIDLTFINAQLEVNTSFFTVVIGGKISQFMDGYCFETGDGSIIPVKQDTGIAWFNLGWESDCDGSFYYASLVPDEDLKECDYKINDRYNSNPSELVKYFCR